MLKNDITYGFCYEIILTRLIVAFRKKKLPVYSFLILNYFVYRSAIAKTRRVEISPGGRGLFPLGVGSHASFVLLLSAPLLLALVAIAAVIWNRTRNPDSILSVNMVAIPPDALHTVWINTINHIAAVWRCISDYCGV